MIKDLRFLLDAADAHLMNLKQRKPSPKPEIHELVTLLEKDATTYNIEQLKEYMLEIETPQGS